MKTACYIDIPVHENGHGVAVRKLFDSDDFRVMHITLKPGEKVELHSTSVNVFFYILEGHCIVQVGGEKGEFSKDTLIDSPAMIPHALYNDGHATVRVMVVKAKK